MHGSWIARLGWHSVQRGAVLSCCGRRRVEQSRVMLGSVHWWLAHGARRDGSCQWSSDRATLTGNLCETTSCTAAGEFFCYCSERLQDVFLGAKGLNICRGTFLNPHPTPCTWEQQKTFRNRLLQGNNSRVGVEWDQSSSPVTTICYAKL